MNLWQRARRASTRGDVFGQQYDPFSSLFGRLPVTGPDRNFEVSTNNLDMTVERLLKGSGPVFSLIAIRAQLLSEARFQFQRISKGRPGDLYGTADLELLEHPWRNGTTGDLLTRILLDVDLAGNSFWTNRIPGRLRRLRPDWTTIVYASEANPELGQDALDAEVVGYVYAPRMPGGSWARTPSEGAVLLEPGEVAHIAPYPDPQASHRGMSWLSPVVREVAADDAALVHKESFFKNGAVPRLAMKIDPGIDEADFKRLAAIIESHHTGPWNAYKTLYLGGGADPLPMTFSLKDLDYKAVTALGETRLAAAAGVPVTLVGFSEGLAGSSLNAGNYGQAKRRFGDGTLRPLWRNIAGSLETLFPPPDSTSRLWFDDRDIAFLRDDEKDAAGITSERAATVNTLVTAGFTPESAAQAAVSGDFSVLQHTGLFSVQLQPPGLGEMEPDGKAGPAPAPPASAAKPTTTTTTSKPAKPGNGSKA